MHVTQRPAGLARSVWRRTGAAVAAMALAGALAPAAANGQALKPSSVELVAGRAGFVDEAWEHRTMLGGAVRIAVTPRLAIGPEVVYLDGADGAHDLTVTGTGTFDLLAPRRDRRVVPFVVFGAGLLRQTSTVGRGPGMPGLVPYTSNEGTVSGGIGVRVALARHWVLSPDVRLGYEPETRIGLTFGWRPRPSDDSRE